MVMRKPVHRLKRGNESVMTSYYAVSQKVLATFIISCYQRHYRTYVVKDASPDTRRWNTDVHG